MINKITVRSAVAILAAFGVAACSAGNGGDGPVPTINKSADGVQVLSETIQTSSVKTELSETALAEASDLYSRLNSITMAEIRRETGTETRMVIDLRDSSNTSVLVFHAAPDYSNAVSATEGIEATAVVEHDENMQVSMITATIGNGIEAVFTLEPANFPGHHPGHGVPALPKQGLPKQEFPKQAIPKQEMPKQEMPKQALPKQEFPKQALPKQEFPKQALPKQEFPKQALPKQEFPKQALPKQEFPKQALPKQEFPKQALPKQEFPKQALPKQEFPKQALPKQEFPKQALPKQEFPKQAIPKQEFPKQGIPKVRGSAFPGHGHGHGYGRVPVENVKQGMPKQAMPKQAMPKQALPKQEVPKQALPKQALPKQEIPKQGIGRVPHYGHGHGGRW